MKKFVCYSTQFFNDKVTLLKNSENFCPRAKLIIMIPKNQIAQGLSKGRIRTIEDDYVRLDVEDLHLFDLKGEGSMLI